MEWKGVSTNNGKRYEQKKRYQEKADRKKKRKIRKADRN